MTSRINIRAVLCVMLLIAASVIAKAISPAPKIWAAKSNARMARGVPAFPIGFTTAPPPDGKTPSDKDAYVELKSNGAVFHRVGPASGQWGPAAEAALDYILDRSAATGLLCAISIPDLQAIRPNDTKTERELRRVVTKYKSHTGLGYWKGKDEPWWNKVPVSQVQRFYDIVRELDDEHPVWITQAPRGTIDALKEYDPTYDIGAIDIYPIGYPPGTHSHLPNKNISVVGDYADWMREITEGRKPFWMVLQIAWSGVINPGRTLRFPTFPEERYMTYQSIIRGARGLVYFGGHIQPALNQRDRALGWNWTFYDKVLKRVLDELNPSGPLHPALIAPDSEQPILLEGADDVEFVVRETHSAMFLLAAKREGSTVQVSFGGFPPNITSGDVLFEEPRTITVSNGRFADWFGPNEVHVYRFEKAK